MKSDVIKIDNQGNGFAEALQTTQKIAEFQGLNKKETIQLKIVTEEMLSLVRSVTGEMQASFWLESTGKAFDLHMATKTVMDREKRYQLISSTTARKNEITNTFLGKLRNAIEEAMASEPDKSGSELPQDVVDDLPNHYIEDVEWDGYERSVLRGLADRVSIGIRGGLVDVTVSKKFAE